MCVPKPVYANCMSLHYLIIRYINLWDRNVKIKIGCFCRISGMFRKTKASCFSKNIYIAIKLNMDEAVVKDLGQKS